MAHPKEEKLIDIEKIGAIIKKNYIVITRDRIRLIPLLAFPLMMILIFGLTAGNIPRHISTAIIAYDNSKMSFSIQKEIASSNVFSIRYMVSSEGEGRKLLDDGKVRVLIVIPQNIEEDINNGVGSQVTLIVDESDSAVAQTARQTLSQIISKISYGMSTQKIIYYQNSVEEATSALLKEDPNAASFSAISARLGTAEEALMQAKKLTGGTARNLQQSLPSGSLYLQPNIILENYSTNTNYFIVTYPVTYSAIKSQIEIYQAAESFIDAASRELQVVSIFASAGKEKEDFVNSYVYQEQKVIAPKKTIEAFTQKDPKGILTPLSYQEKPAYGTGKRVIDFTIANIIALTIFQGAIMGMGRAIAGEKKEGSLTRVFLTPTSNVTIISGTLLFYILFELCRSAFILLFSVSLFHVAIEGSVISIGIILIIYAAVSTSIGMIISTAVKSEQQFMAMAMLISMPTTFLSGAFFPLQSMPKFLQVIAQFLPVTYAGEALRGVMIKGFSIFMILPSLAVLCIFLAIALSIVFTVFKREIE